MTEQEQDLTDAKKWADDSWDPQLPGQKNYGKVLVAALRAAEAVVEVAEELESERRKFATGALDRTEDIQAVHRRLLNAIALAKSRGFLNQTKVPE